MKIYTPIAIDLQRSGIPPIVQAKQNDRDARGVIVSLYDAGVPWNVPVGALALFRFKKPDGTAGFYDKLEDGKTPAMTATANTVTAIFVEQVLTAPGDVFCEINFYNGAGKKLTTFSWVVQVQASALSDAEMISSDYYNVLSDQIAAVLKEEATAGASAKAAATSATAAKASETTAAQKAAAAAASATAAASSSTIATTKAAEAAVSATAAQGYKTQAQQLRDEVHTIVAGNEAYTKQETRDSFARALTVESSAAAAQVISVEPQSDLRPRYYGFTEQAGTGDPSPTNIRPITVGGNAANLIPFPYADGMSKTVNGITYIVQSDGSIKMSGTANGRSTFRIDYSKKIEGVYTLNSGSSLPPASGFNCEFYYKQSGGYGGTAGSSRGNPVTFAATSEFTYNFFVYFSSGTTVNATIYPMLNAGDIAYPYIPYTGYEYAGLMAAQGANLIPRTYQSSNNGVILSVNTDDSITLTGTSTATTTFFMNKPTPMRPCTISMSVNGTIPDGAFMAFEFYDFYTNKFLANITLTDSTNKTITLNSRFRITPYIRVPNGVKINTTIYPMLNVGTTAIPYKPYIPPTNYTLHSPVALPDGCSVKAGYVDADKMIVFDGSENWQGYLSGNYFVAVITPEVKTNTNNQNVFSNLFPQSITTGVFTNSAGQIAVNISKDIAFTLEESKAELARLAAKGTPLTIYYQSTSYAGEKMPVWLVNVTKKKVVLGGSETIDSNSTSGGKFRYSIGIGVSNIKSPASNDGLAGITCSHYIEKSRNATYSPKQGISVQNNTKFYIFDERYGNTANPSGFKSEIVFQYENKTPITIVYELDNPETYAIPYTRCESPDTVNCTISTPEGTCSALYNADLKTYIGRLQSAIIALGGTI